MWQRRSPRKTESHQGNWRVYQSPAFSRIRLLADVWIVQLSYYNQSYPCTCFIIYTQNALSPSSTCPAIHRSGITSVSFSITLNQMFSTVFPKLGLLTSFCRTFPERWCSPTITIRCISLINVQCYFHCHLRSWWFWGTHVYPFMVKSLTILLLYAIVCRYL